MLFIDLLGPTCTNLCSKDRCHSAMNISDVFCQFDKSSTKNKNNLVGGRSREEPAARGPCFALMKVLMAHHLLALQAELILFSGLRVKVKLYSLCKTENSSMNKA